MQRPQTLANTWAGITSSEKSGPASSSFSLLLCKFSSFPQRYQRECLMTFLLLKSLLETKAGLEHDGFWGLSCSGELQSYFSQLRKHNGLKICYLKPKIQISLEGNKKEMFHNVRPVQFGFILPTLTAMKAKINWLIYFYWHNRQIWFQN